MMTQQTQQTQQQQRPRPRRPRAHNNSGSMLCLPFLLLGLAPTLAAPFSFLTIGDWVRARARACVVI